MGEKRKNKDRLCTVLMIILLLDPGYFGNPSNLYDLSCQL